MPKALGKIIRYIVIVTLLIIGIAGVILPVLHGVFFLLAAVILLSLDIPALHHLLCKIQKKYPRPGRWLFQTRLWMAGHGENPPACNRSEEKILKKGGAKNLAGHLNAVNSFFLLCISRIVRPDITDCGTAATGCLG